MRRLTPILFSVALATFVSTAFAAETPEATGTDLDSDTFVITALTAQKGQTVTLRLLSGEEIGGKVSEVGEAAVKLTELTGKEFYEALIRTEDIAAVIVRSKPAK